MHKKSVLILLFALCAFSAGVSLFSQALFNGNVSAEERQKLADGEILIRNIGKAKNISLNPVTPQAAELIERVKKLKPAYLAEVIQIRPLSGNEDLIQNIKPLLLDIEGYVGIPYWSERAQDWFDLYSSASVVKNDMTETGGTLNVDLYMLPFGDLNVDIGLSDSDGEVFYSMINTGNVKYENITVVRPEKMQSFVYAFKYNDFIVLYGIGGVNAPSVFFLRERIELSFINRIKTFCKFIFEKLE